MAIVDRKFSQQSPESQGDAICPKPLSDFFCCDALIVLGDPGAGKTTSFEQAASEEPDAVYVKIRDFFSLNTKRWTGKTLYLDGLDEQRSKSKDGTAILDDLRQKLDDLDSPRFRLSCRSADWYGSSDLESLNAVAPSASITVISIEPLSVSDILVIAKERVSDPILFLEEAHKRGIDELLTNPQTLDLILTVVKADDWPSSRTELFEKACEILLREENTEHDRAHQDKADKSKLLQSAGYLCAICLCGGLEGIALSAENSEENFPFIGDLEQDTEALRIVAQRRLFKGAGPEQRMPLHRTIAEFLAASYLRNRISDDLPVGRVKSILTGYDGGTLSDLRGVYAWLACLSPQFAPTLIPSDPLGIVLYGDVAPLAASTKKLILANLRSLAKRHPWFLHNSGDTAPFGALACHDLLQAFREILADPNESITVKSCVVDAIQNGAPLPELAKDLLSIARDSQIVSFLRRDAVKTYHKIVPDNLHELIKLLNEIHAGAVRDNGCYLRGYLLRILYPTQLSPTELVNYIVEDNSSFGSSSYTYLLGNELVEKTSDVAIPDLIEAVIKLGANSHNDYSWGRFVGGLVAKGLNLYGEVIETEKLHDWFAITLNKDRFSVLRDDEKKHIRDWSDAHPQQILKLFDFCVSSSPSDKLYSIEYRFHAMTHANITLSGNYKWFLCKAKDESDQTKAEYYFSWVMRIFYAETDNGKPTLDGLYSFIEKHPRFTECLKSSCFTKMDDWRIEDAKNKKEMAAENEKNKVKNNEIFSSMLDLVRTGQHVQNLKVLASIYKGFYSDSNKDLAPYERLIEDTSPEIAAAALDGFRAILYRDDIPTPKEIAQSRLKDKSFYVGLPLLIGMNLCSVDESLHIFTLPESALKSAIVFHYLERDDKDPSWLREIFELRPVLAAEAFHDFWKPQIKARREHVDGIYELDNKPEMAIIAKSVAIPLLTDYPNCHPSSLEHLLWAALLHSKLPDLLELTRQVLERPGVVKGKQRVLWLGTGFLINPDEFVGDLRKYIGHDKDKAYFFLQHVKGSMNNFSKGQLIPLDYAKLGIIIEIVASAFPPFERSHKIDARVSNEENVSTSIYTLIDKLRNMPDQAAGNVLKHLISKQALKTWRNELLNALAIQQQNCREAAFRPPTIKQVIETIKGGKPANLPDLKEVVLDHLKSLRDEFRNGSLDGYKDFWNLDQYGRAKEAIPENDCRDRLLSRLKPVLLRQGIQAEPEGHFAEDKRADIKVLFSSMVLPVEIKRHYHKDVWTAPTEQLLKRYSRDPGASGHGIYMVFWFGIDFNKVPKPPNNVKLPVSAVGMEEEIRKTISDENSNNVEVIVFDCSRPIISDKKLQSKRNREKA